MRGEVREVPLPYWVFQRERGKVLNLIRSLTGAKPPVLRSAPFAEEGIELLASAEQLQIEHQLFTRADVQLAIYVRIVLACGMDADEQTLGDLARFQVVGIKLYYLALRGGKRGETSRKLIEQRGDIGRKQARLDARRFRIQY